MDLNKIIAGIFKPQSKSASPSGNTQPAAVNVAPAIGQARYRPIVFRQTYPPAATGELSFYGGVPVGPANMKWPRGNTKRGEAPFHFVMQWHCPELAAQDAIGLLPKDGVLYLFADLEWGDPMAFRFVHTDGPAHNWLPLSVPDDLGPAFGDQGIYMLPYMQKSDDWQNAPKFLPQWPFKPLAIDYPQNRSGDADEPTTEDEPGETFWEDRSGVAEQLLVAQNSLSSPLTTFKPDDQNVFERPYPRFPHDWAAVRIVCSDAIEKLSSPYKLSKHTFMPGVAEDVRAAKIEQLKAEAETRYAHAAKQTLVSALSQAESDEVWEWIESARDIFALSLRSLAKESVNVSLGLASEGASTISAEHIAENSLKHALAHEYVREQYQHEFVKSHANLPRKDAEALWQSKKESGELQILREVFAPTPNHMFGPPSYVQGNVEEYLNDHVLLLELCSNNAIGFDLGEGVLQFLIRPEDLRAKNFENVKVVVTAY